MLNDILIVDDDEVIVDFVMEVLHTAGYHCCATYDGESALLAIEIARPMLVLLDLHLPGLTGLDVVEQLNRFGLMQVPVILMTADSMSAELITGRVSDYLFKPFTHAMLIQTITRALESGSREREA